MGSHLALPGADPSVDGGHHCGSGHTGRRHGGLQAQFGVDEFIKAFDLFVLLVLILLPI